MDENIFKVTFLEIVMQVTLDIKKRETFAIVIILLLIAVGVGVYASTYQNPTTHVGHDLDEVDHGTIDGDLEISGNLVMGPSSGGVYLLSPPDGINGSVSDIMCNINPTLCTGFTLRW